MNILWLPHAPLHAGRTRTDHLAERLAARRHAITLVSFRVHARSRPWRYICDLATHRSRRGPPYDELAIWRFPRSAVMNGWLLNRAIRRELLCRHYDVLVVAPAPYITGFLDFAAIRAGGVKIICDYLDGGHWTLNRDDTEYERTYVRAADAVMCVSHGLLVQATTLNPNSFYVPNGVDLARYREFRSEHTARECKAKLGIDPEAFVVSIIGMTCSSSLYFVDAVLRLVRKGKHVVLLLVGDSPLFDRIRRRSAESPGVIRIAGSIPYSETLPYFMASDLGLYAVDDEPYYHFALPLKVLEYAAMDKKVLVAPRLSEIERIGLSQVSFSGADAVSLARAIERMTDAPAQPNTSTLDAYDWDEIASRVETILAAVSKNEPLIPALAAGLAGLRCAF